MKPSAILCSDIHLRFTVPRCRIDDFMLAQTKKIKFISDLQKKHNCSVICAGDLFHKAKSDPSVEAWGIKNLPNNLYSVAGQHDLPEHNIKNIDKSSFGVLSAAKKIFPLQNLNCKDNEYFIMGLDWGEKITSVKNLNNKINIAVLHSFVQNPTDEQDKIIGGHNAFTLMRKLKNFNLIVAGDNHKTFVVKKENQILVNPGSIMRTSAGQIAHRPCVFLYYFKDNHIEQIFLPIEKDVFDISYLEKEKDKEIRLNSFVKRMNDDYEIDFSFEKNLENYFKKNKTKKSVQEICWEVIEN